MRCPILNSQGYSLGQAEAEAGRKSATEAALLQSFKPSEKLFISPQLDGVVVCQLPRAFFGHVIDGANQVNTQLNSVVSAYRVGLALNCHLAPIASAICLWR
jgi:hypothetical protein